MTRVKSDSDGGQSFLSVVNSDLADVAGFHTTFVEWASRWQRTRRPTAPGLSFRPSDRRSILLQRAGAAASLQPRYVREMSDDTILQPIEGSKHENFGGMDIDVMTAGETRIKRLVYGVGDRWSEHVKPLVGTDQCMHAHVGFIAQAAWLVVSRWCTFDFAPAAVYIEPVTTGGGRDEQSSSFSSTTPTTRSTASASTVNTTTDDGDPSSSTTAARRCVLERDRRRIEISSSSGPTRRSGCRRLPIGTVVGLGAVGAFVDEAVDAELNRAVLGSARHAGAVPFGLSATDLFGVDLGFGGLSDFGRAARQAAAMPGWRLGLPRRRRARSWPGCMVHPFRGPALGPRPCVGLSSGGGARGSGAQTSQPRSLQIRPRWWAISWSSSFDCFGSLVSTQSAASIHLRWRGWSDTGTSAESPIVVPSIAAFGPSRDHPHVAAFEGPEMSRGSGGEVSPFRDRRNQIRVVHITSDNGFGAHSKGALR